MKDGAGLRVRAGLSSLGPQVVADFSLHSTQSQACVSGLPVILR